MADKYRPTMVIGLGGTGKKIIVALKKMIAENSKRGMADFPFLKLLSIDTDDALPNTTSAIKTIKSSELSLDANKEVYSLRCGFANAPDLNDYPEIKEWFPESLTPNLTPAMLKKGAGQKKPVGRFTFAWNAKDIYLKIQPFLMAPVDIKTAKERGLSKGNYDEGTLNVFICGSICGGTGAGTFLDTAYIVRKIESELAGVRSINIFGILAMSTIFEGISGAAMIKPNCYASLMEMDHFMNEVNNTNPYRLFHPAYKLYSPDYSESALNKGPFDYPFIFDRTNSNGLALNNPEAFAEMAARFIYLLTGHEVSNHWVSMNNNVVSNIEVAYKKDVLNKSINYRSMGTFSIMYPKRLIVQLCAYKLSKEYLNKILDDSYAPQEITNLVTRFLNGIKLNPSSDSLEKAFENYRDSDGFNGNFSEYVEMSLSNLEDEKIDKKEVIQRIRSLKSDLDIVLQKYKELNYTTSRNIREKFLGGLKEELKQLLDLHELEDKANKNADGQFKKTRGSIVRTEKFIETLLGICRTASEKYRKRANDATSSINNLKNDFETSLSDLDEVVDGFNPFKKKLNEAKERVYDSIRNLFVAEKDELVANWIRELFDNILENGVPKYTGLIEELEEYKKNYLKSIDSLKNLDKEITKFIEQNKRFDEGQLCDILFDYHKDIENTYTNLMEEKGEDFIFGNISDYLTEQTNFGPVYEKLHTMTSNIINLKILGATEDFFFEPINKVRISERIFENKDILNNLEKGTYINTAGIFLNMDNGELSRVGLDFENSTFFAVTIPNDYDGKPCSELKGVVKSNAGGNLQCPMDANPEKYENDMCPMYGKCLKQLLLKSAPENLAITPTSETSEINIVRTIAGFPLHACSTAMQSCKPEYDIVKKKYAAEDKAKNIEEEKLNMFGTIRLDDLDEKTIDPKTQLVDFRKKLLLMACAGRLIINKLSVDFVTSRDIQQGNKDKPSLHFGKSIDETMRCFESTANRELQKISKFDEEYKVILDAVEEDSDVKEKLTDKVKKTYKQWCKELPQGLKSNDFDLLNEVVQDVCGITLIEEKHLSKSDLIL